MGLLARDRADPHDAVGVARHDDAARTGRWRRGAVRWPWVVIRREVCAGEIEDDAAPRCAGARILGSPRRAAFGRPAQVDLRTPGGHGASRSTASRSASAGRARRRTPPWPAAKRLPSGAKRRLQRPTQEASVRVGQREGPALSGLRGPRRGGRGASGRGCPARSPWATRRLAGRTRRTPSPGPDASPPTRFGGGGAIPPRSGQDGPASGRAPSRRAPCGVDREPPSTAVRGARVRMPPSQGSGATGARAVVGVQEAATGCRGRKPAVAQSAVAPERCADAGSRRARRPRCSRCSWPATGRSRRTRLSGSTLVSGRLRTTGSASGGSRRSQIRTEASAPPTASRQPPRSIALNALERPARRPEDARGPADGLATRAGSRRTCPSTRTGRPGSATAASATSSGSCPTIRSAEDPEPSSDAKEELPPTAVGEPAARRRRG